MTPRTTKKRTTTPGGLNPRRLTPTELRTIAFVATLVLAGIAIAMRIDASVVWTFLGMAVGIAFGQGSG